MTVTQTNVYRVNYQTLATSTGNPDQLPSGPTVQTLVLAMNDSNLLGIIAAGLGVSPTALKIIGFSQIAPADGNVYS
jgi:hypothetical protein